MYEIIGGGYVSFHKLLPLFFPPNFYFKKKGKNLHPKAFLSLSIM